MTELEARLDAIEILICQLLNRATAQERAVLENYVEFGAPGVQALPEQALRGPTYREIERILGRWQRGEGLGAGTVANIDAPRKDDT